MPQISLSSASLDARQHSARIVVIDDDALVRDSLCVYLEDLGYEVFGAANALDGITLIERLLPHLVLCDLRMPDLDGLHVLAQVTRDHPEIPVIVVSGAGMIADVVEALRLGATDYLVKPLADMAVLDHAVMSALQRSALQQENQVYKVELEKANGELQKNLDVLRQDHEAGRQAQLQLLPEPNAYIGRYQFSHAIIPSLYLSGDFLDYFEIDQRYVGFYIADVSGHGAASAFVTMMLKSLINHPLRQFRQNGEDTILHPERMLAYLNHEILQAGLGKYLTLFYGVIDRDSDSLVYANAGHFPRPLLLRSGQGEFLGAGSFPVGLFDWANYSVHQTSLSGAFRLVLASDGVLEILALSGAAKEEQLLSGFVAANSADLMQMVDKLRELLPGLPPDDIALFQIEGKNKNV